LNLPAEWCRAKRKCEHDPRIKVDATPITTPQPDMFGPALQPHQLFSIEPLSVPAKPAPVFCEAWVFVLLTMRLKLAAVSSVKPVSASRKTPSALFRTVLVVN